MGKRSISRREFIRGASSALLLTYGPAGHLLGRLSAADGRRPNILFVFADDHACQAISAYGSRINSTPNIDRIAAEGALFENSFCTNSICAPSRAVVLTGKYSHLNGVRTNMDIFDGSQPTFPQMLQAAGYQTAMFGKWHLKSDPTGFDHWQVLPGQGNYYNPDFKTPDGRKHLTGYATDVITDLSLDWLRNGRKDGQPFLLHCWHKAPHRRWLPGPAHLTSYDDTEIPEPPTLFDDYSGRTSSAGNHKMGIGEHMSLDWDLKVTDPLTDNPRMKGPYRRLTPEQRKLWDAAYVPKNEAFRKAKLTGDELVRWKYQRYTKDYLRCIASVDDNVGRLLAYLDETGLAKDTLVIYSSDQGFYLGEHGWFDKRWIYEESLRMPLIMRWPGVVKPGTRVKELVQNIDYAPTLVAAAGLAGQGEFQGRSMLPLLKGSGDPDWRSSIYYHYFEHGGHGVPRHYGLRTKRYKLARFYVTDEWELFDLERDPHELRSVYDGPAYAGIVAELKEELERLREKFGDREGEPYRHKDFGAVFGVYKIEQGEKGWSISADRDGAFAMRKLENPFSEKFTLSAKVKSLKDDGIRNGMIAFGRNRSPEDVIRCGVYIGASQYVMLENGNHVIQSKTCKFDKNKTFDVTVTVDLEKKKIDMTVDGEKVSAPLKRDWREIRYVGYGLNNTTTLFAQLEVEGR